jgi:hypothetical protein
MRSCDPRKRGGIGEDQIGRDVGQATEPVVRGVICCTELTRFRLWPNDLMDGDRDAFRGHV